MNKTIVTVIMIFSMLSTLFTGCGQKKMEEDVKDTKDKVESGIKDTKNKVESDMKETKDDVVSDFKEYIKNIDQVAVVKDAKDFDFSKSLMERLEEARKGEVKKITVDDSKIDYSKPGTYPAEVTMEIEKDQKTKIQKRKIDVRVISKEEAKKQADLGYLVFGTEDL